MGDIVVEVVQALAEGVLDYFVHRHPVLGWVLLLLLAALLIHFLRTSL